jgi:hypothetical protein
MTTLRILNPVFGVLRRALGYREGTKQGLGTCIAGDPWSGSDIVDRYPQIDHMEESCY